MKTREEVKKLCGAEQILPFHEWVYIDCDGYQDVVFGLGDTQEGCENDLREYLTKENLHIEIKYDQFHQMEMDKIVRKLKDKGFNNYTLPNYVVSGGSDEGILYGFGDTKDKALANAKENIRFNNLEDIGAELFKLEQDEYVCFD